MSSKNKLLLLLLIPIILLASMCAKRRSSIDDPSFSQKVTASKNQFRNDTNNYSDPLLLEKINRVFLLSGSGENTLSLWTPDLGRSTVEDSSSAMEGDERPTIPLDQYTILYRHQNDDAMDVDERPTVANDQHTLLYENDDIQSSGSTAGQWDKLISSPAYNQSPSVQYVTPIPRLTEGAGDTLKIEYEGKTVLYQNESVLAFNRNLESTPINRLQDIQFKKGEDSVFLVAKDNTILVNNLLASPINSIVANTIEFRILQRENGVALIHALNLEPSLRAQSVYDTLSNMKTFISEQTFRSDPQFPLKQAFVEALGSYALILGEQMKGRIYWRNIPFEYSVEKQLGKGSFGSVFWVRVFYGQDHFDLAIKQPKDLNSNRDPNEMPTHALETAFLDAMSRHPNSIQVYGAYPVGDGKVNIVMDLAVGTWRNFSKNDPTYDQTTHLFIGAADAYAALHEAGMVHYDIKAGNLFFSSEGQALVGDYGLARSLSDRNMIPGSLVSKGTYIPDQLKFLTPEMMKGDPFKIDVFAFGIAMLEMRLSKALGTSLWNAMKKKNCCISISSDEKWTVMSGQELLRNFESEITASIPKEERELIQEMLLWDLNKIPTHPTMSEIAQRLRATYSIYNM